VVLRRIAESGLTTREACGNTVRNVTACPYAGVSHTEPFDVTPYAEAVAEYFLRNPINQNLPRKIKIAFEGCDEDHARVAIHDIGAVAKVREVNGQIEHGFQLYFAGGLGAQPRTADLLEEFTPASLLIPTAEAIIRVFDRHGERRPEQVHRMRARMKFLARGWGIDKLRRTILIERRVVLATRSGRAQFNIEHFEEKAPLFDVAEFSSKPMNFDAKAFAHWRETNVAAQRQTGWNTVTLRCPLGDIDVAGLRNVARIARRFSGGRLRIGIAQNFILRWVPDAALSQLFIELSKAGLAQADADRLSDITRCPGADTCMIALTNSRGLAEALTDVVLKNFANVPEVQDVSIKISGCMNSCGQHHIADIGFHGASETTTDGRELPAYIMMVGGSTTEGLAQFAKIVGRVPAQRVPETVNQLLRSYANGRQESESFRTYIDRIGIPAIKTLVRAFEIVPSEPLSPELFFDLGAAEQTYKSEVGVGECAG
jgi:sulfite reductase beta subunit-like hemoprotein